jgi:hypothetical protein
MWEPRRLTTLWASTACYKDTYNITRIENLDADPCTMDSGSVVLMRVRGSSILGFAK